MDAKDRVVVERYPAEKLPDEFAEAQRLGAEVRIIFESVAAAEDDEVSMTQVLEQMQNKRIFSGDPVKRIRALRAEWDWRDEFHDRIRAGDA